MAGPIAIGTTAIAPGAPSLWNEVTFQLTSKEGYETHLFSARDDHAAQDKGHRQRWALQKNQRPFRRRLYVMIDPGHGRFMSGGAVNWRRPGLSGSYTSHNELHEDDSNFAFSTVLQELFEDSNYVNRGSYLIRRTRTSVMDLAADLTTSLNRRYEAAEAWFDTLRDQFRAKGWQQQTPHVIMVSIHTNAGVDTAHGAEGYLKPAVYAGQANEDASRALAQAIHDRMITDAHRYNRPPGYVRVHVNEQGQPDLRIMYGQNPHIPVSLTEVLFHTNTSANTTPPLFGGTPEFDLLRNGIEWTVDPATGGGVVTIQLTWWGRTTGMPAMKRGITNYFASHPSPP